MSVGRPVEGVDEVGYAVECVRYTLDGISTTVGVHPEREHGSIHSCGIV